MTAADACAGKRSAAAIAADVSARRRSAVEVAEAAVARIERENDALNAIVTFDADMMLADAADVDRRVAAGESLPLAGVPVAVKDNIWVAGRRVTQGSKLFADFVAPTDAIAVERLRKAGAVVAGMANTSEFACTGRTTNLLFGPTRHPQDHRLTPGGSSGGPVAAVAGGMVPLALGTDGGGSSRRPPAHVGVVGFKSSFGAIPYGPGFAEPFIGISVIAPIAHSVADAALAFDVLRGPDKRDPDSQPIEQEAERPVASLTVAYSPRLGLDTPVDADVSETIGTAVEKLAAAGARIVQRDPIWPQGASEAALMPIQQSGLAQLYGEKWWRSPDLFHPDVGRQIERGVRWTGAEVASARMLSTAIARAHAAFFADVDLLLCPTTPCVAWPIDQLGPERVGGVVVEPRAHAVFTPFFNHAKAPAISIPCGRARDGLPVGLQIIGPRGADLRVLAFAAFAEQVFCFRTSTSSQA